ncbi:MAG: hypothetical protein WCO00_05315 [Rhodospirillaceae bacterium]
MLSLQDCIDLACTESGMKPDEIAAVAEHEKLPYIVAVEKGAWMMEQAWGPPALRQIIQDDLSTAVAHGSWQHVNELTATYREACQHLPAGVDRRHYPRH